MNDMILDEIREYIVVLNGGSGCIFQVSDPNFTYILTAKHVVADAGHSVNLLRRFVMQDNFFAPIEIPFDFQNGVNYFEHPDRDVAILKIDKLEGYGKVIRTDQINHDRNNYILAGYPAMRRNLEDDPNFTNAYRTDEGVTIQGPRNNSLREAQVPDRPNLEEIRGHSGGALGKLSNEYFLLGGIQSQMVEALDEQLGKVEFSPLSSFDDLVRQFPDDLVPILPAYLGCFSFLQDAAFLLEVNAFDEESVVYTRNFLKAETEKIVGSAATPYLIKQYFNVRLLLNQSNSNALNSREIWVVWLEFLTVLNVMEYDDFNEGNLKEIFNSFRLLFSDTDKDWTHELQNMIYSDYRGLPAGGLVVVGTRTSPLGDNFEIEAGKIPNLMKAQTQRKFLKTDDGINFPFDHYRFIHIDLFKKKCILSKLEEYREILDEDRLIAKLQEEYEQYIKRR